MESFGYGYSEAPDVLFYGGNGTGAEANASIINGAITKVLLHNGGFGYDQNVTLELNETSSGDSIGLSATVDDGVLKNIPVLSGGLGYRSTDLVNVFDLQNSAYGASEQTIPEVDENGTITQLTILEGGRNYDANYLRVSIVSTTGNGFEANTTGATIEDGVISSIEILDPGSGYTVGQDYTISVVSGTGGAGSDLNASISGADIKNGAVRVNLISQGSGYTSEPVVILSGGKLEEYEYPYSFLKIPESFWKRKHLMRMEWSPKLDFFGNGLGSAVRTSR